MLSETSLNHTLFVLVISTFLGLLKRCIDCCACMKLNIFDKK